MTDDTTHPRGEALFQELLWVHQVIRRNLETIAGVVAQISNGASAADVRAQIDELATSSVVWTLRVNCMQYCSLVHHHHQFEDRAWFPALRRINPELHRVIDRLEADHVQVSRYLDAVEAAAERLGADETARVELARALGDLADHLLAHLDYEETNLAPTLRRIRQWPPR